MLSLLIDEDLPRSLAPRLQRSGFSVRDVRDVGLRGAPDTSILEYAVAHDLTLVTSDVGFANVLNFPIERHHGIIAVRFPNEISATQLIEDIARQLFDSRLR